MIEPSKANASPLRAILEGLAGVGFTLAVFDTAGADNAAARFVTEAADLCLLPARPTRLDVDATAATFRAVFLAKRKAAFVLNQCPSTYRSSRASDSAKDLTRLGLLAEPMLACADGFSGCDQRGSRCYRVRLRGRAAQEIQALWGWIRAQFDGTQSQTPVDNRPCRRAAA